MRAYRCSGVSSAPFAGKTLQKILFTILVFSFTFLRLAAKGEAMQMDDGHGSLWVQLCDCVELESKTLQGLIDEVVSIYSSAGVNIHWKESCSAPAIEAGIPGSARVYIVSRLPSPVRSRFYHQLNSSKLMAYTFTDPGGTPGAVIHVSIESVEANAKPFGAFRLTPELRSRALGRVVAHELAHRFLQSPHTQNGLLKASFDNHDLIDEDRLKPYFTPEQGKLLRTAAQQKRSERVKTADSGEGLEDRKKQ